MWRMGRCRALAAVAVATIAAGFHGGVSVVSAESAGINSATSSSSTASGTCSASAEAAWQSTCSVRTINNKDYIPLSGMEYSEINIDETDIEATYNAARINALKLSGAAGNAAMGGMRKKTTSWYQQSLTRFTTYLCVMSSDDDELERCVNASSSHAARDIDGNCIALTGDGACSAKGMCERESNCKWDDPVAGASTRREIFTSANVTTAESWMENGYPKTLAPFVAPGIVFAVLTAITAVGFLILRCVFNQCGGRNPREKGYTRCDILVPSITFTVCSLAVFICMVVTAAQNTNITEGVNGVLYSVNTTLENVEIFASNLETPLKSTVAQLANASTTVNASVHDLDWIAKDGATLRQMIADYSAIYSAQGPFPNKTCDKTSFACISCPSSVCGTPLVSFVNTSTKTATNTTNSTNNIVLTLQDAFVNRTSAISTAVRTALLEISNINNMTQSSQDVVDVIKTTFNDYSFSRKALVLSVFFFGMLSSVLGIFAIFKGVCTKNSMFVQLLHVSWLLNVLVCILGFVLSASLLAVGAVWYDSCKYLNIMHTDISPYVPTQMGSIINACFNDTSILTPLGLDSAIAFSCDLDDNYAALEAADFTALSTLITEYGEKVSNFDLTDFGFDATQSRTLLSRFTSALKEATGSSTTFTQEKVLRPWEAFGGSSSQYDCTAKNLTDDSIPICYMDGTCASVSNTTDTVVTKCKTAYSNVYYYLLAFSKISSLLDEMREDLLGDTGMSFSSGWTYDLSIREFAATYVTKLQAVKTDTIEPLLATGGDVRNVLQSIETMRCSESCGWINISYNAVYDSLCNDILGTTLAISLCVFFLCLFLLPMIVTAITLQKRLRGVKKGTYEQLEKRLQELETRSRVKGQVGAGGKGGKMVDLFKSKLNLDSP